MTKQDVALQLTLKLLETSGTGLNVKYAFDNLELETYTGLQSKIISTIFNNLLEQLNCE